MKIKIKLKNPQFTKSACVEYEFEKAEALNDGTHMKVRDSQSCQILFICRLDNIDCFEKER